MRRTGATCRVYCVCLAAVLGAGCGAEDADRLSRVSRMTGDRLSALSGGARDKFTRGWQSLGGEGGTLREQVAARLRLDKALAGARLEVDADGAVVTLRGEADEAQRQRAVDLARSTVGVDRVVDELQSGE